MLLVDHLSVGVPDIVAAKAFYDRILEALGSKCLVADKTFAAYGSERVEFLLLLPFDGGAPTAGNGAHVAFCAGSPAEVDAFYRTGIEAGGRDEGPPGLRDAYPWPGAYAAYIRDPFGNKLEAIYNGFTRKIRTFSDA